jgi:ABC-type polar amino acid transport system ATPase subunit
MGFAKEVAGQVKFIDNGEIIESGHRVESLRAPSLTGLSFS